MAQEYRLRITERRSIFQAVIVSVLMLIAVWIIDHYTLPHIDLSIAYFLPVAYTAWHLGRPYSISCALISDIPAYIDQSDVAIMQHQSLFELMLNLFLRFLIFVFVAEIVHRLSINSGKMVYDTIRLNELNNRLENSNEELQIAYNHIDDDLKAAGALQGSMLSISPIDVKGCQVGSAIKYAGPTGGDYADAGIRDGKVYICVADISGKGTPAALFTMLLEHLLKDAVSRKNSPSKIVEHLNEAFLHSFPFDWFVTLFYAEMELETGIMEYVNAGHVPGLMYRSESGNIDTAENTCALLGSWSLTNSIKSKKNHLDYGDILVVYTDGMIESKLLDGSRLGDEFITRIIDINTHLSAQEIADNTISEIESVTEPSTRDDMTIVCLKRI